MQIVFCDNMRNPLCTRLTTLTCERLSWRYTCVASRCHKQVNGFLQEPVIRHLLPSSLMRPFSPPAAVNALLQQLHLQRLMYVIIDAEVYAAN